jgi:penicillin amidase
VVEFANSLDVGASNSWVISGNLTKSGKPILANDPHLDVTIPSEWYQFSLEYTKENGKQILFKGAGVCGALGNFIGRTPYASWGCTNVYTDTQDLYKEKLD